MSTTTLNDIRSHKPCADGWEKLLQSLGKTKADDEPLPLVWILESNGLKDAIWCLRAIKGYDREIRLFAVACVRRVEHLHPICKPTLDVAERFANGQATREELRIAWAAATAIGESAATAAWVPRAQKFEPVNAAAWAARASSSAVRAAGWMERSTSSSEMVAAMAAEAAWDAEMEFQRDLFIKFFGEGK